MTPDVAAQLLFSSAMRQKQFSSDVYVALKALFSDSELLSWEDEEWQGVRLAVFRQQWNERGYFSRLTEVLCLRLTKLPSSITAADDGVSETMRNQARVLCGSAAVHAEASSFLTGVCSALRSCSGPSDVSVISELAAAWLRANGIGRLLRSGSGGDPQREIHELLLLPTLCANKLGSLKGLSEELQPVKLASFAAIALTALPLAENGEEFKNAQASLCSHLLGQLCLSGYADCLWNSALCHWTLRATSDPRFADRVQLIMSSLTQSCVEAVIVPLLQRACSPRVISLFVGPLHRLPYEALFTRKLLFLRHYSISSSLSLVTNLIGYLASQESADTLPQLVDTMLEVWSDANAIRDTSYSQHLYMTVAIASALGVMSSIQLSRLVGAQENLIAGVSQHLASSIPEVRLLGLVLGEVGTDRLLLSNGVVGAEDARLRFDFVETAETSLIRKLALPCSASEEESEWQTTLERLKSTTAVPLQDALPQAVEATDLSSNRVAVMNEDLDSDDELVPMDMSADVAHSKINPPRYVRACLTAIVENGKPEQADMLEAALNVAEDLVRSQQEATRELACEFTEVMLHFCPEAAFVGWEERRMRLLVALCVVAPQSVSDYLCAHLYSPNISLGQRLDILEVIQQAANELSQFDNKKSVQENTVSSTNDRLLHPVWRQVVDNRIAAKSRRLTSPAHLPLAVSSNFAPVAGHFFYALLRSYDSRQRCLDMLGTDHVVLAKMLITVGTVIRCAGQAAPVLRGMAVSLCDLLCALRSHTEPVVRRAAFFALAVLMLTAPSHMLFPHLSCELTDLHAWCQSQSLHDADSDCRALALSALSLMGGKMRASLGIDSAGR